MFVWIDQPWNNKTIGGVNEFSFHIELRQRFTINSADLLDRIANKQHVRFTNRRGCEHFAVFNYDYHGSSELRLCAGATCLRDLHWRPASVGFCQPGNLARL